MEALRTVAVAVISSITQIALTIAFTSLAFRGELVADLRLGLTAMFAGLAVAATVVAVRSDLPGHLAGPQDSGLVVISAMVPSIVASADRPGPTVLVLLAFGALSVGITMFVLGSFGLGRLIRYLPFPVMAGFLAGTGLVMGKATIELLDVGMGGDASAGADRIVRFLIGGGTAAAMVAISRSRLPTERLLPALVLGMIVVVHVGLTAAGIGRGEAASRALLLPELPSGPTMSTESLTFWLDADWGVVADRTLGVFPLLVLAPLTLLLYLGALEAVLDTDIDANREFRLAGGVNVVSGTVGAGPSYTQFAATVLVQRMARGSRVVPFVVGCSAIAVIALGDHVVALAPQPVVAGLLGFIALSFVLDWLWDTVDRMSRTEWALALAIALSILFLGFLTGVAIGIAMTAAWFIVEYSRMSGVRRLRDATHLLSNVERAPGEVARLERSGGAVLVVEPEGFLFFGTGDSIVRRVTARAEEQTIRFLIMDLSRVTGADSSASAAIGQLTRWARRADIATIWCGVRPGVRRSFGAVLDAADSVLPDLDRALEWTEVRRLADDDRSTDDRSDPSVHEALPELRRFGRRVSFASGDELFRRGEIGPGLLIVEEGWAEVVGAPGTRRRRVGPGAVLGDIGLVHDGAATATVVADTDVAATVLDRDAAAQLERTAPHAAAALYRHIARSLSQRLLRSDAELASFAGADEAPATEHGRPDDRV